MGIDPASLALIAAVAGGVISGGAAIYSGRQQEKNLDRAAEQDEADAAAARGQAMVEARKIRDATKAARSNAVAALAASGVDVSSGTAEQIQTDIDQRGEEDAITTILTGSNRGRFLEKQGAESRYRGGQAATAGYLNATGSVLSSVASSARGWKGGK